MAPTIDNDIWCFKLNEHENKIAKRKGTYWGRFALLAQVLPFAFLFNLRFVRKKNWVAVKRLEKIGN